jgi:hypothetical protein
MLKFWAAALEMEVQEALRLLQMAALFQSLPTVALAGAIITEVTIQLPQEAKEELRLEGNLIRPVGVVGNP